MSALSDTAFSWYTVPDPVKQLLMLAVQHWDDTALSEQYIHQALAMTPDNVDVFMSAYRYFFYKQNFRSALQVAVNVMAYVQTVAALPQDWETLKGVLCDRKEDSYIRLYLSAYAASGLVRARLGELDYAKEIMARVKEIDDKREFGATTIFEVLTRPPDDEDG